MRVQPSRFRKLPNCPCRTDFRSRSLSLPIYAHLQSIQVRYLCCPFGPSSCKRLEMRSVSHNASFVSLAQCPALPQRHSWKGTKEHRAIEHNQQQQTLKHTTRGCESAMGSLAHAGLNSLVVVCLCACVRVYVYIYIYVYKKCLKNIALVTGPGRPSCDKACNRIRGSCDKPSLHQDFLNTKYSTQRPATSICNRGGGSSDKPLFRDTAIYIYAVTPPRSTSRHFVLQP